VPRPRNEINKKCSKNPSPRRVLARHSLLDGSVSGPELLFNARHSLLDGSVSGPELLFNIIMLIQGDN
jgi:hypothetical protein